MGYDAIKQIAKEKNISLEYVAKSAGITYNSLSQIMHNTIKEPQYTTILNIARALNISIDELAYRIDGFTHVDPSNYQMTSDAANCSDTSSEDKILLEKLKDRIALIIKENQLKQKDLSTIMGVSESYVSTLLSGRNKNLSTSVAKLIEEKLGYNSKWILSGDEPKLKHVGNATNITDAHKKAIMLIEKMPVVQVKAVMAFMDSLDKIENTFKESSKE